MLIVCPSCLSAYRVPLDADRDAPAKVRCAQCGDTFEPAGSGALACVPPTSAPRPVDPPPIIPAQRAERSNGAKAAPRRRGAAMAAAAAVAAIGLVAAGLTGRDHLVRVASPAFAAAGLPLPGLRVGKVETALGEEGPVKVLTLTADITNTRSTGMRLPNVRIVVRDDRQQSLYSWVAPAPRETLGPGEATAFRSRLVSPPPNGHDLVVSLADDVEDAGRIAVKAGR